jgi:hypothetical protein
MHRDTLERVAGIAFFVAFVATHFMFGITAAVRMLGIACVFTGLVWSFGRSVPVGIEDRPPSFFLRGFGALLAGLTIIALGIAFMIYAAQAACILGWTDEKQCA